MIVAFNGCVNNKIVATFDNKVKTLSYSESSKLEIIEKDDDNIKVFRKTIKQYYYDKSNEEIAKLTTLKKVEMELSKEVGQYISINTALKNFNIHKDEMITISSTLLDTKIIDEKKLRIDDKFLIQLTVECLVDTLELEKSIENVLKIEANLDKVRQIELENHKFLNELISLETRTVGFATIIDIKKPILNKKILDLEKLAFDYALKNDFTNAVEIMSKIIELNEKNDSAYFYRGYYLVKMNEKEKAISDFKKGINLNPRNITSYINLANIYVSLKNDYKSAFELIDKVIIMDSNYANAYHIKGNIYNSIGSCIDAIENYDTAIKLNKNPIFFNSRAVCNIKLKRYSNAFRDLNNAINLNNNYSTAYKNRGMLYYELGNIKESVNDSKKACNLGDCKLQNLLMKNKLNNY